MGDFDLNYNFNCHLEESGEMETVDWEISEQIFGTEGEFSCSEVSIDVLASTSQTEAEQEMKQAFQPEEKENFTVPKIQDSKKRFKDVS